VTQDLTFKPATELLGLMAAKELSPVELLEACLARIEALDGKINAFTHMLTDEARAAAAVECETRSPARGERAPGRPSLADQKDLALVSGTPITMGSRMSMEFPVMIDSEVVARLRAAGAVIPGKTHMPEFGSTMSSESVKFAATRNPWDLERSPGGSSSGAAAAVAAGLVPVAHGADGGGSLRIPASCCGLFTVKPTRARISQEPIGDVTENNVFGFLTHTVADNVLLIDNVEGVAFGDPYWCSPLERPLLEEVGADPGRLRIGWTVKPPITVEVDSEWAAAVEDAARLCEELGTRSSPTTSTGTTRKARRSSSTSGRPSSASWPSSSSASAWTRSCSSPTTGHCGRWARAAAPPTS
jgi:amidase